MVAVKIDKVDKTSPLHPNMLLGKIVSVEDRGCVKTVTLYGKINTRFSTSRLTPCTATNVHLDYSSKIFFRPLVKRQVDFLDIYISIFVIYSV